MSKRDQITQILKRFDEHHDSVGISLRIDLASIILRAIDDRMSQKELAAAAKMSQSYVSRVVNTVQNCEFDVAGRLLHALGLRGRLVAYAPDQTPPPVMWTGKSANTIVSTSTNEQTPPKECTFVKTYGEIFAFDTTGTTVPVVPSKDIRLTY